MRVYEVASLYGLTAKELMEALKPHGIIKTNPAAGINADEFAVVQKILGVAGSGKRKIEAKEASAKPVDKAPTPGKLKPQPATISQPAKPEKIAPSTTKSSTASVSPARAKPTAPTPSPTLTQPAVSAPPPTSQPIRAAQSTATAAPPAPAPPKSLTTASPYNAAVTQAPSKPKAPPAPKPAPPPPKPEKKVPRPPIVTILGHVDHGKTTLLDYIRKTRVAAGEAGGITQSIGAYQAEYKNKKITFIDTPGHKAFANMRARGAAVTDMAVLVVAADDGVMEQTKEAFSHARAAQVPILIAINKTDKPTANVTRVKNQLSELGLLPEEYGGDTITVSLSAVTGQGVDDLLEMILLVAELEELAADPDGEVRGIIIESYLDQSKGPIATVIVRNGTLRERDVVISGVACGRIRALLDDRGKRVQEAPPGTVVQILGLSETPSAGATLETIPDMMQAKVISEKRAEEIRQKKLERGRRSIQELFQQQLMKQGRLQIILKADSAGTLEALEGELKQLKVEQATLEFLHTGIGNVSESDTLLASSAEDAAIIGFRVGVDAKAAQMAEAEGITIRTYEIIYQVTEDVRKALASLVEPQFKETKIGEAQVRNVFRIPNVGTIAGCFVRDGNVQREARVRVVRSGAVIFDGALASLKRFTEDVRKVEKDKECGLKIAGFDKISVGDTLEFYLREAVQRL
jgi:translation initiation factor IF-2